MVCGLVTQSCPTLATLWTIACQAPLSTGFSRQEYWCGLPFSPPGDLPNPGIEPGFPALQEDWAILNCKDQNYKIFRKKLGFWLCNSYLDMIPMAQATKTKQFLRVLKTTISYTSKHQFSCSVVSNSLWPQGLQHARLSCPSAITSPRLWQLWVQLWVCVWVTQSCPTLCDPMVYR